MAAQRQNALVTIVTNPQSAAPLTLRLVLDAPAVRGQPISARLVAAGGTGGYVFNVDDKFWTLPDGVTLNAVTGEFTGTPTTLGTTVFGATVEDSSTTVASGMFSLTIVTSLGPGAVTPLPGEIGIDYEYALSVTGATGAVTWTVLDGNLPAGLDIDVVSNDTIVGTPTGSASISYATLQATDAGSGDTLEVAVVIQIVDALSDTAPDDPIEVVAGVVTVISVMPFFSGGVAPYSLVELEGSFPPGLALASNRGRKWTLIGTPTYSFSGEDELFAPVAFTVTDALGASFDIAFQILVINPVNSIGAEKNGTPVGARTAPVYDFTGTAVKDVTRAVDGSKFTIDVTPQASARSVLGVAGGTGGDAASLTATADNQVLARLSGALTWTQITTAMLGYGGFALATQVMRGDGTWSNGVSGAWVAAGFNVGSSQVVGARQTGFGAPTGTADKATYATYASVTIGATYNATTQSQLQAISTHLQVLSRQIKALKDAMLNHGLIGT